MNPFTFFTLSRSKPQIIAPVLVKYRETKIAEIFHLLLPAMVLAKLERF